jgi:glycerol uptake facilitator-like aquaporin
VSHYRDQFNPEAVHFPAREHVAWTYVAILLALVVTAILTLIYGRGTQERNDLATEAACLAVAALYFPKRITTDETGVRASRFFGFGQRLIRWNEIEKVQERALIPGIPPFSAGLFGNWVIEVCPSRGVRPIRLTCRHCGQSAFLRELKRWGAPVPDAELQLQPPEPEAVAK